MKAVLNIRAAEMATLRDDARRLRRRIAEMEAILRDNDETIAMMHRLSLLLISRRDGWRRRAETLLRRGMKAAAARIDLPQSAADPLAGKVAKLPAGGRADAAPLHSNAAAGALYYHLPLKDGRRAVGLLTLTLRRKRDLREGEDEFCRRLAALLAAALAADGRKS